MSWQIWKRLRFAFHGTSTKYDIEAGKPTASDLSILKDGTVVFTIDGATGGIVITGDQTFDGDLNVNGTLSADDIETLGDVTAANVVVQDNLDIQNTWEINNVAVTATAAELNLIDGSVAGTAVASKAAVLGANKELDEFHTAALYLGAAAGTQVTSSAAELNVLAGVTAGTALAAGAVVLDSNYNINGIREKILSVGVNTAASGSNVIYLATAADLVFTLPSTAAGLVYTFIVSAAALSGGTGLSVRPTAIDKIMGTGITSADDKDLINDGATDTEGDMVTLVGDGADGWYITAMRGTWSREG